MSDSYPTSSRDYVRRAEERLADDKYESLFYAAFELRCGIEARMQEYMENWSHISEKKKQGWKIAKLGKDLEKAFKTGNKVVRWAVSEKDSRKLIVCFYHTPVTTRLRKKGERLGEYLHAMKKWRHDDDPWWDDLRFHLNEVAAELRIANTGTLLGPPMMQKDTAQVQMNMEVPPGVDLDSVTSQMMERNFTVNVSYLQALPGTLETEAVVWRG